MLPGRPGQLGWVAQDDRLLINAVLYTLEIGVP